MCAGTGSTHNHYVTHSIFAANCPRCKGTGIEPSEPTLHAGLKLRNRRSGKVWIVFHLYSDDEVGIHRFKKARSGGHYVWQIMMMHPDKLLARNWEPAGYGDAWEQSQSEREQQGES
jgi:hypothetical protein